MNNFQQMMDSMQNKYEEVIANLERENTNLRQKLAIFQDGSHINMGDYQKLEQKWQNEVNEVRKLSIRNDELENNILKLRTTIQTMEGTIEKLQSNMTNGFHDMQSKDNLITSLRNENMRLEQNMESKRQELASSLGEKQELEKQIQDLCIHQEQLQNAVNDFMERDKQLIEYIKEQNVQLTAKDEEINELQRKLLGSPRRSKSAIPSQADNVVPPKDNEDNKKLLTVNSQLSAAKKEIRELKSYIVELQEEEKRGKRLQNAFDTYQKQMDKLRDLLNKNEQELLIYKQTSEDFSQQLQFYKEERDRYTGMTNDTIKELRGELVELREQYEAHELRISTLTNELEAKVEENCKLRDQVNAYEAGTFGLPEAVNQMKELRAMVDVRENHISELVTMINSMDKIINGFIIQAGSDFDMENFLANLNENNKDDEEYRIQLASRELEAKIKAMRSRLPIGDIEIVVDNDVFNTGISAIVNNMTKKKKKEGFIPTKKLKKDQKKKRSNADNCGEDNDDYDSAKIIESLVGHPDVNYTNVEIQTESLPIPPTVIYDENNRDEWVSNLQKQFINLQNQNKEINNNLEKQRQESTQLQNEITKYKELLNLREQSKVDLVSEINELKEQLIKTNQQLVNAQDTNLKLQNRSYIQQQPYSSDKIIDYGVIRSSLFISMVPHCVSIPEMYVPESVEDVKPPLFIDYENIVYAPSQDQIRYTQNMEKDTREKLQEALRKNLENENLINNMNSKLETQDKQIAEDKSTIEKLESQLSEQREMFKQKIREIQAESDRNTEMRVKEIKKATNMVGGFEHEGNLEVIPEVAHRLTSLNSENLRLTRRVEELQIAVKNMNNEAVEYKETIRNLEKEINQKDDIPVQDQENPRARELVANLQHQNIELKRKVNTLKDQNEELKRRNATRSEFESGSNGADRHIDSEELEKAQNLAEKFKQKYQAIKAEKDESQQKLAKEKENNERLKQMLAKREQALQKLTDKYNQFKHQNEKLKAALSKAK